MATTVELKRTMNDLRTRAIEAGQNAEEASRWEVYYLPTQTWAVVRVTPDNPNVYEVMYGLGDTKGEALDHLRGMIQGVILTQERTLA
jgi:hypothetical protein